MTPAQAPCPRCEGPATVTTAKTAIWRDEAVVIVEDIPALVCAACQEQFYDEDVSDALRRLMERGFPDGEAARHVRVPVFSLQGVVPPRAALPDDTYVD